METIGMMKAHRILLLVVILFLLSAPVAAKDLTHRISVGYNSQTSFAWVGPGSETANAYFNNQAISTKYWWSEDLGFEGIFGYFTAKNKEVGGWAMEMAMKVHYNLNKEENMNLYTGGGLGLLPSKIDFGAEEESALGFIFMGFMGMEFFLPGLPNLGFDVEFGLQYIDIDTYSQFSTYGGGFGLMGIRYYF
jgi:Outer membrane protein beta-barrel domain